MIWHPCGSVLATSFRNWTVLWVIASPSFTGLVALVLLSSLLGHWPELLLWSTIRYIFVITYDMNCNFWLPAHLSVSLSTIQIHYFALQHKMPSFCIIFVLLPFDVDMCLYIRYLVCPDMQLIFYMHLTCLVPISDVIISQSGKACFTSNTWSFANMDYGLWFQTSGRFR